MIPPNEDFTVIPEQKALRKAIFAHMELKHKFLISLLSLLSFYLSTGTAAAQNFSQWEKSISGIEKKAQTRNIKPRKYIVFTGSSSIVGWNSLAADFPNKKVLNHGFGGSQTFEVLHFAERIITPYKPKQVVIYSGDNDIAAGKSPQAVLADFTALFNKIREASHRTWVTFISIKPSPSRKQYMPDIVRANQLIKDFLASRKRTSYADVYNPMLLPNGKPKPELFKSDSLHMVSAGYKLWAEVLKPHLK